MRTFAFVWTIALVCSVSAEAQPFADSAYVPPVANKAALDTLLNPIPQATLEKLLGQPVPHHVFDTYAGLNDALAAAAQDTQPLAVGSGYPTDLASDELFDEPRITESGDALEYLAAITSVDAVALRLQVDLSALQDDQQVYVVDPLGPRAYGPYTGDDMIEDGRWLPTIEGDTAVLLASTPTGDAPQIRLVGISHFYRQLEDVKELSCNINAACLTDEALADASAGVGIMVRTFAGDSAVCSGTLINNPNTAEYEPYYLTANHCIPGAISAQQADIIWDFRTSTCNSSSPPSLSSLPRSNVVTLLETSSSLDMTLVELDTVPSGQYGRTYVGWDTRTPDIGDNVLGIHHPDGAYMRTSFGHVTAINQPGFGTLPYIKQTEVKWDQGVTEGGSSGSCLLFENNARIMGTLSNGPTHSCIDISRNKDRYASFRDFFPEIQAYVSDGSTGPIIQKSDTYHSFGTTTDPWTLTIWNSDSETTLNFAITGIPDWATVTPDSGQSTGPNDQVAVTVNVVTSALSAGLNTASLVISGEGATSTTVTISAWGAKMTGCSGAVPGQSFVVWSDVFVLAGVVLVLLSIHRLRHAVE